MGPPSYTRSVVDRKVVMRRMTVIYVIVLPCHTQNNVVTEQLCVFDPQVGISKETRVWTNNTTRYEEDCAEYTVADVQQTHWPRKYWHKETCL